MHLLKYRENNEILYAIITGNGGRDYDVFDGLCEKFNGYNKFIWYPKSPIKKVTGLDALDAVKEYPIDYNIKSLIFIIDKEHIRRDPLEKIERKLNSIGININNIEQIQDAFLLNCQFGNYLIILYCIIMGDEVFLEEEIIRLIKIKLNEHIDMTGKKNSRWKNKIKKRIGRILRRHRTDIKRLMRESEIPNLEKAFPNICVVLKRIEENIVNNLSE